MTENEAKSYIGKEFIFKNDEDEFWKIGLAPEIAKKFIRKRAIIKNVENFHKKGDFIFRCALIAEPPLPIAFLSSNILLCDFDSLNDLKTQLKFIMEDMGYEKKNDD